LVAPALRDVAIISDALLKNAAHFAANREVTIPSIQHPAFHRRNLALEMRNAGIHG
jgi:hypothetical protein